MITSTIGGSLHILAGVFKQHLNKAHNFSIVEVLSHTPGCHMILTLSHDPGSHDPHIVTWSWFTWPLHCHMILVHVTLTLSHDPGSHDPHIVTWPWFAWPSHCHMILVHMTLTLSHDPGSHDPHIITWSWFAWPSHGAHDPHIVTWSWFTWPSHCHMILVRMTLTLSRDPGSRDPHIITWSWFAWPSHGAHDPHIVTWLSHGSHEPLYLQEKSKVVHRDLATRNVLVVSEDQIKISDFGLARERFEDKDYYQGKSTKDLPIYWYS